MLGAAPPAGLAGREPADTTTMTTIPLLFGLLLQAAAPDPAKPQPAPPPPAAPAPAAPAGYQRVALGPINSLLPYTVEIPSGWEVRREASAPGMWIAPPGARVGEDPRLVYVRLSPSSLADPRQTVANIQKSDAADASWSAPEVAVREVKGITGVLVRMDRGEGATARSSLIWKLPWAPHSIDFTASAPRAEFDRLRPTWERIFFSIEKRPGA